MSKYRNPFKELKETPAPASAPVASSAPAAFPKLPPGAWVRAEPVAMDSGARAYRVWRLTQLEDGTLEPQLIHDTDIPSIAGAKLQTEAFGG